MDELYPELKDKPEDKALVKKDLMDIYSNYDCDCGNPPEVRDFSQTTTP